MASVSATSFTQIDSKTSQSGTQKYGKVSSLARKGV